ncbi:MAG: hypothetical protein ACMG6E_02180 [Candidatus Roizmanbacteria bacterium]
MPLTKLYLNIPYETRKGEKYILPVDFLHNLPHPEKIILQRGKDYGSITKILPVLHEELLPETLIITFDDDLIYDDQVVATLVEGAKKYDGVIGLGGWIVGSFPFLYQPVSGHDRQVDWVEGKTAVLYPRKYLPANPDDLLEHPFPKHLSQHDDHILTYHVAKLGVRRYVVGMRTEAKTTVRNQVTHLDSISGNGLKYLSEVRQVVKVMKEKHLYIQKADISQTYGFTIVAIVMIIVGIIMIVIGLKRSS